MATLSFQNIIQTEKDRNSQDFLIIVSVFSKKEYKFEIIVTSKRQRDVSIFVLKINRK